MLEEKSSAFQIVLPFSVCQKTKIRASGPISSWQKMGKQWKQWLTLFFGAPKSLHMVIAAMILKDAYSLEGML